MGTATGDKPIARRVRLLREGMNLSLRDLAERSGVSAQMLSQVERGETSPTLAVAERIAAGLELTLSQLLRLDEGDGVNVVRTGERRDGGVARGGGARGGRRRPRRPPLGAPPPPAPGAAPGGPRPPPGAGPPRGPARRPADPRAGQPRDRGGHRGQAAPDLRRRALRPRRR